MNSADLSAKQLEAISEQVRVRLHYLYRLKSRMERCGFPVDDDLYRHVAAAEDAMHRLRINLHYRVIDATRKWYGPGR